MIYSWSGEALCKGMDTNIFFGYTGEEIDRAKKICAACPVKEVCLKTALENHEDSGVWGGLAENERENIRRRERYHRKKKKSA